MRERFTAIGRHLRFVHFYGYRDENEEIVTDVDEVRMSVASAGPVLESLDLPSDGHMRAPDFIARVEDASADETFGGALFRLRDLAEQCRDHDVLVAWS